MQKLEKNILHNAILFSLTRRSWRNRAIGDMDKVTSEAEKSKLKISKTLIAAEELDAINQYLSTVYNWCLDRSMFSCLRPGVYFVKRTAVEEFETMLAEAVKQLRSHYVPALAAVYPAKVEASRVALKDQYDASDYPTVADLPNRFGIEWSWLELGVPKDLPKAVREREDKKLRAQFAKAQDEILHALRSGFREMVSHAVDRLKVEPGEKPKVFKASLVENFNTFFSTFQHRNLMEDGELQSIVDQAKAILKDVKADKLRTSASLRNNTAAAFSGVKAALDKLIQDAPGRHLELE